MKTGVIGLGVIGKLHLQVLQALGEQITALCDTDAAALEYARKTYAPVAACFTDYHALLESGVELVHICTPHDLHADMVIAALDRGLHVLCEKPLCMDVRQIEAVLAAERRASTLLGVCHQNRFLEANRFAKDFLASHRITAAHGSVVWGRDAAYYAQAPWRGTLAHEGGGVLINQALHTLDLMQWLCGMPTDCTASVSNLTLRDAIEVEDTVAAVYHREGLRFTFFATNAGTADLPVQLRLRLENGSLLTVLPDSVQLDGREIFRQAPAEHLGKPCYGSGHWMLIRDFHACAAEGRPFSINGWEGMQVVRLILAAYQSHGLRVTVP